MNTTAQGYLDTDPVRHTADIKERLTETISTITSLREDVAKANDPRIRALFDTTREVLKDLVAAYDLYERATASFEFSNGGAVTPPLTSNSRSGEA